MALSSGEIGEALKKFNIEDERAYKCTFSEAFTKNLRISERVDDMASLHIENFLQAYVQYNLHDQERRNRFIILDFLDRGLRLPLQINGVYDLTMDSYVFNFQGQLYNVFFCTGQFVTIVNRSMEKAAMIPYTDIQVRMDTSENRIMDEKSTKNLNIMLWKILERVSPLIL